MTVRLRIAHLRDPMLLLATGFGSGLVPRAPGTAGTLPGLLLAWLSWFFPLPVQVLAVALVCAMGVMICGTAARRLGVHDHPAIVWDEMAGVMLALLFAPPHWSSLVAGFLLFRLFDVWKPWPICLVDRRLHGGLGIMLDDLLAGLYAALPLWVAGRYAILPAGQ